MNESNGSMGSRVARLLRLQKSQAHYLRVLAAVSMILALVVAVGLRVQGIAANTQVRVLDCHYAGNGAHTHDASCYDTDGNLVCPLEERALHTHTDACYTETRTLVCGLEESADHTHTDACYQVARELTCGQEEVTEQHVHGPGCFRTMMASEAEAEAEATSTPNETAAAASTEADATAADMPAQEFSEEFTDEDDNVVLRVEVTAPEGALPAGTTMQAEWVDVKNLSKKERAAVKNAVAGEADGKIMEQQAVDISFFDAEGNEVEPAKELTVTFTSGLIESASEVVVAHVDDLTEDELDAQREALEEGKTADEAEPARKAQAVDKLSGQSLSQRDINLSKDQLAIEASNFSMYVLSSTSVKQTLSGEASGVEVTVTAPAGAGVPADAQLLVSEVEDTKYDQQVAEVVPEENVAAARFLELAIVDASGQEVELAEPVRVSVQLAEAAESTDGLAVVGLAGEAEVVKQSKDASQAKFKTEQLGVYGLVQTLRTVIEAGDGSFEVTVAYGLDAGIPQGASLSVTELQAGSERYQEAYEAVVGKKAEDEDFNEGTFNLAALDIKILDANGGEVEPTGPVAVNISMNEIPAGLSEESLAETLEVQHIVAAEEALEAQLVASAQDDNDGEVTVADGTAVAAFEVDGFSTYTITWEGGIVGQYIQNISDGDYIIYARDAYDSNRFDALAPSTNTNKDLSSVRLGYSNGRITYSGNQNLLWHVDVSGTGNDRTFTISYTSGGRTYYVYPTNENPWNGYTANLRVRTNSYTWKNWSNHIHCGQDIFLRSNNGQFQVWHQNNGNWQSMTQVFFAKNEDMKSVTVHYGYMNGDEFVEFDKLPDGAEESYGGPERTGDQLNLRYDIEDMRYVTTRINNPSTGTQISPLLQTEKDSYSYWRYKLLSSTSHSNAGIDEWQRFAPGENDLYVIYETKPTATSSSSEGGSSSGNLSDPEASKGVEGNGDGTYDVTLSVKGEQNQSNAKTHANVVIVLDTSSSMYNTDSYDTGEKDEHGNTKNRLQVAKESIIDLANTLQRNNTSEDPRAVELAFVSFAHRTRNELDKDTIYSGATEAEKAQFINMIKSIPDSGYDGYGGTQYDTAIEAANSVRFADNDPLYIVFITDGDTVSRGYPEYDEEGHTDYSYDGGTYYTDYGDTYSRQAANLQVKKVLSDPNNRFYSIGVFGTTEYLASMGDKNGNVDNKDVTKVDYLPGYRYLGSVNEKAAIDEAFASIISEINSSLGYDDVEVTDGITDLSHTMLVDGSLENFTYTITDTLGNNVIISTDGANSDGSPVITGLAVNPTRDANGKLVGEVTSVANTNDGEVKRNGNNPIAAGAATITYEIAPAKNGNKNVFDENGHRVYVITVTAKQGNTVVGTWSVGTASFDDDSTVSAEIGKKSVKWMPTPEGLMPDKWKYDLSFTVWPSQAAYDLIANLDNGAVTIDQLKDAVNGQLVVEVDGKLYTYTAGEQEGTGTWTSATEGATTPLITTELMSLINSADKTKVFYYLKTNTKATLDYTPVSIVNGDEKPGQPVSGSTIPDPHGKMILTDNKMQVEKQWNDSINGRNRANFVDFYLLVDGKYYEKDGTFTSTSAPADENDAYLLVTRDDTTPAWIDTVNIAAGLVKFDKNGQLENLFETGHDYTVIEKSAHKFEYDSAGNIIEDSDSYQSFSMHFTSQTVRPMVLTDEKNDIHAQLTYLILVDEDNPAPAGARTYTIGSKTYYVAETGGAGLVATNHKTPEMDITKKIVDETGKSQAELDAETFTYEVTLNVPEGTTAEEKAGINYWVYEPVSEGGWFLSEYSESANTGYQPFGFAYAKEGETESGTRYFDDASTTVEFGTGEASNTATATVTMHRTEVIRFNNLPLGTTYTIVEKDYTAKGYEVSDLKTTSTATGSGTSTDAATITGVASDGNTRYYNQFTNTLATADFVHAELKVQKNPEYGWEDVKSYEFTLEPKDGAPMPEGSNDPVKVTVGPDETNQSTGSAVASFGTIRYTEAGEYQYTITETVPKGAPSYISFADPMTVTVTVKEQGGELVVTDITSDVVGALDYSAATDTALASGLATITNREKGITFEKVDATKSSVRLDGASFELLAGTSKMFFQGGKMLTAEEVLVTINGDSGTITDLSSEAAKSAMKNMGISDTFTMGSKEIPASAFNKDTVYTLHELKAPDGYVIETDSVYFKVENSQITLTDASGEAADSVSNASVSADKMTLSVKNTPGAELPMTGGAGTTGITALGAALMAAGAAALLYRRRNALG